jgi:hypothetical protein
MGRPAASFTTSAALVASRPVPQRTRCNVLPKAPRSSASAPIGDDHDLLSMVEDAKFSEYLLEHSSQTRADLASPALSYVHHHREEGSLQRNLTEVNFAWQEVEKQG